LIDDRNLGRLERRHAGAIERKSSAGAGEQAQDHGVLGEDIGLKDLPGVAVEFEHAGIERQHVLGRDVGRRCRGQAGDRRHVGGQGLGMRDGGAAQEHRGDSQPGIEFHVHTPPTGICPIVFCPGTFARGFSGLALSRVNILPLTRHANRYTQHQWRAWL
jgi:hypothetical protein